MFKNVIFWKSHVNQFKEAPYHWMEWIEKFVMVPVFGFSSLQFNSYVDFSHKINSNEEMARHENSRQYFWSILFFLDGDGRNMSLENILILSFRGKGFCLFEG